MSTAMMDGREAARRAVVDVLRGQGFAADTLRALGARGQLNNRELGLATQIALGTVRHILTIEHILSAVARFDRRRVRAELRTILYTAAYQMIWLDRIPLFAAVDQAVSLARRHVRGRAPAMVNAILRRLGDALSQRRTIWHPLDPTQVRVDWDQACAFNSNVLPSTDSGNLVAHLAAATGERLERYEKLIKCYGEVAAEQVAWASQAVPVTIVHRNHLRITTDQFATQMQAAYGNSLEITPDLAFLPPAIHVATAKPFSQGDCYVQDSTAHSAALLVETQSGERILDLCAAPGGKTVAMAIQMADRGEVVACDTSAERLELVRQNATRLGLKSIQTQTTETAIEADAYDAVLLDVPCSNTGVLARRPEARLGFTAKKLAALVTAQRELIETGARCVRPGGRLVYSTCSLEPEENEQMIVSFLARQPGWRLDQQLTTLPNWGPRLSDWRDGGYAARLVRSG
ncbi:MAG: transcription antitermination factor NusB [Planctomycetota bacterium]